MKLIKPSFEIISPFKGEEMLKQIEIASRTCYKSEGKIEYKEIPYTDGVHAVVIGTYLEEATSARKLITKLIKNGHEAMLEFSGNITVKFICDRGISHELVRHRIASFAQESSRYCNYGNDEHIQFIIPEWTTISPGSYNYPLVHSNPEFYNSVDWFNAMLSAEGSYNTLIKQGWQAQQARSVLPNSVKTEINVSTNVREWRHIFKLRCAPTAHPQMQELMIPLLHRMQELIPIIFDDIDF